MKEVFYGDQAIKHQTYVAILDSGSSYIIMPEDDFDNFKEIVI